MKEIHDSKVISYFVDYQNRRMIVNTQLGDKKRKIIFNRLISHQFIYNINGCILFDIDEVSIKDFIDEFEFIDLKEKSKYGWPIIEKFATENEFSEIMEKKQAKIYQIISSYGFQGWIFTSEFMVIEDIKL